MSNTKPAMNVVIAGIAAVQLLTATPALAEDDSGQNRTTSPSVRKN